MLELVLYLCKNNEEKVLVTGGAGYIGSHSCRIISFRLYANNCR